MNWPAFITALSDTERNDLANALSEHYAGGYVFKDLVYNPKSLSRFYHDGYIEAIKECRARYNLGLKEAKDMVDAEMVRRLAAMGLKPRED